MEHAKASPHSLYIIILSLDISLFFHYFGLDFELANRYLLYNTQLWFYKLQLKKLPRVSRSSTFYYFHHLICTFSANHYLYSYKQPFSNIFSIIHYLLTKYFDGYIRMFNVNRLNKASSTFLPFYLNIRLGRKSNTAVSWMEDGLRDPPLRDPIGAINLARWELKAKMTSPDVTGPNQVWASDRNALSRRICCVGRREQEQISGCETLATKRVELC